MNQLTNIYFLIAVFGLTACSTAKWPSGKYIIKHNYKEVTGESVKAIYPHLPIDKMAMYPNGLDGIFNLVLKETKYPQAAKINGIRGIVIVETDGYVREIDIIQSVHPLLDEESIRVTKKMERWIPAFSDGVPVRCAFRQRFKFSLR